MEPDNLAIHPNRPISRRRRGKWSRLTAFFHHLFTPLHLSPFKILAYAILIPLKLSWRGVRALLRWLGRALIYPFRSRKHFFKAIFRLGVVAYFLLSLLMMLDYFLTEYGRFGNFFCGVGLEERLRDSVVRVSGAYSEGSGFFINPTQILTNFHVIAGEPSPKIIFPDGQFVAVTNLVGDESIDLALLTVAEPRPELVLPIANSEELLAGEPVYAAGYPLAMNIIGPSTVLSGRMVEMRRARSFPSTYIQTDISLVQGMSGGPLVNYCGRVVGINTQSLAGISFFINANWAVMRITSFSDERVAKIEVDPAASPEKAVEAFYTYLKARRLKDGFALLSSEYLQKTDFEEWTSRFPDVLDVSVFATRADPHKPDLVEVHFATKTWNGFEVVEHFYSGTWQTIKEDGVYKMKRSQIREEPDYWTWLR